MTRTASQQSGKPDRALPYAGGSAGGLLHHYKKHSSVVAHQQLAPRPTTAARLS